MNRYVAQCIRTTRPGAGVAGQPQQLADLPAGRRCAARPADPAAARRPPAACPPGRRPRRARRAPSCQLKTYSKPSLHQRPSTARYGAGAGSPASRRRCRAGSCSAAAREQLVWTSSIDHRRGAGGAEHGRPATPVRCRRRRGGRRRRPGSRASPRRARRARPGPPCGTRIRPSPKPLFQAASSVTVHRPAHLVHSGRAQHRAGRVHRRRIGQEGRPAGQVGARWPRAAPAGATAPRSSSAAPGGRGRSRRRPGSPMAAPAPGSQRDAATGPAAPGCARRAPRPRSRRAAGRPGARASPCRGWSSGTAGPAAAPARPGPGRPGARRTSGADRVSQTSPYGSRCRPEVCDSSRRTVSSPCAGTSAGARQTGSSRSSSPSSRHCITSTAVNVLVTDPIRNRVSGVERAVRLPRRADLKRPQRTVGAVHGDRQRRDPGLGLGPPHQPGVSPAVARLVGASISRASSSGRADAPPSTCTCTWKTLCPPSGAGVEHQPVARLRRQPSAPATAPAAASTSPASAGSAPARARPRSA